MPVETRSVTNASQGRTQTTTTVAGTGTQNIGAQTTTSSETRGAHTVETSSTKAAVTVSSVRQLHEGIEVTFRVPFEMDLDAALAAEGATADLGPDCA